MGTSRRLSVPGSITLLTVLAALVVTGGCFEVDRVLWSPDGRHAVFRVIRGDDGVALAVLDRDSGETRVMIPSLDLSYGPWAWSGDGDRLVVVRQERESARAVLVLVEAATARRSGRLSLRVGRPVAGLECSGPHAFVHTDRRLFRVHLDTGKVRSVQAPIERLFRDGDDIYYLRRAGWTLGRLDTETLALSPFLRSSATALQGLPDDVAISRGRIALLGRMTAGGDAGELDDDSGRIQIIASGEASAPVGTPLVSFNEHLEWSRDGRFVQFACFEGNKTPDGKVDQRKFLRSLGVCRLEAASGRLEYRRSPELLRALEDADLLSQDGINRAAAVHPLIASGLVAISPTAGGEQMLWPDGSRLRFFPVEESREGGLIDSGTPKGDLP